jgi:hypothetical protein
MSQANQWINFCLDMFDPQRDHDALSGSTTCPPEPGVDEQPATEDPAYIANCQADVRSMSKGPVVWGTQLLTHSEKWGLIWRADFWKPERKNQGDPIRVACWKNDKGETGMTISGCKHKKLAELG